MAPFVPRFPQKTATAVAHCKRGNGLIKVNGRPLEMIEPRTLQYKVLALRVGVWDEWRALERGLNKWVPGIHWSWKLRDFLLTVGSLEAELGTEKGAFGDRTGFSGGSDIVIKEWTE